MRGARRGHGRRRGAPQRLLIVVTANISNTELFNLFEAHLDTAVGALEEARFVEIVHDDRT